MTSHAHHELQNLFFFLKLLLYSTWLQQDSLAVHAVTKSMELKINTETGGRLADQEVFRFFW
jgi:hypothetical protein